MFKMRINRTELLLVAFDTALAVTGAMTQQSMKTYFLFVIYVSIHLTLFKIYVYTNKINYHIMIYDSSLSSFSDSLLHNFAC